ncbi:MAG: hypothetical protein ACOX59_08235 [Bacteroidales bacterium]|jgi:hypothetical protein|nr:hypothetical protein [Bacteroidales bacterium]MDI9544373.1 hypothetical protein [Bacteroidota bacterium]OQC36196.1 MAG: hypothetical protein BWX63_02055 [Bacteroidetes bacterium ADurb.Bin041]NLV39103.1 hypothetical protein [Bacteroidales bacterium]HOD25842.1 hypothetical protein [Bacteroidales bacterium]
MKTLFLLCFLILLNSSCCLLECTEEDDPLYLKRMEYSGSDIKLNGYYYNYYSSNDTVVICEGHFFYNNGIILNVGGLRNSFDEYDNYILDVMNYKYYKNQKACWGVFIIEDDKILLERWQPFNPFRAYIKQGEILNDTTFQLTKIYRMVNEEKTDEIEINEIFHFREFSPKPDSTNVFIK